MSKICGKAILLSFVCMWNCGIFAAQKQERVPMSSSGDARLRMVVILSRHGVRSPTWTQERLNRYSAQPWPAWNVPPGYLTSRGYELIQRFGSFDRASLEAKGLLRASGCADAAQTYIWADTEQRTVESGRALAQGLFSACPPAVHSLGKGETDPLFHPAAARKKTKTEVKTEQLNVQQSELLAEMQNVLLGCDPKVACQHARMPAAPLLSDPNPSQDMTRGSDPADPLDLAGSFAEDFLLEYAQGMPMNEVGWGNVDEAQLRRFLELHSLNFDRLHRAPAAVASDASNMLFHIVRTLQQQVEGRPLADAINPVGSKLVVIAGHDTNLAGVAALLGLHWTLDGRADDTPPGTEMAFELWQDEHGAYSVRLTVSMQTLEQLRSVRDLTLANAPVREPLAPRGCDSDKGACAWEEFYKTATQVIDMGQVFPLDTP